MCKPCFLLLAKGKIMKTYEHVSQKTKSGEVEIGTHVFFFDFLAMLQDGPRASFQGPLFIAVSDLPSLGRSGRLVAFIVLHYHVITPAW